MMMVKRFYDDKLAQVSYLIGSTGDGAAVVIDPNRDAEQYVDAAAAEGLTITHVTETHIHADFVSGSRELAARTGARLYLSAEGGADWAYAFAAASDAVLLKDGDAFDVGSSVRLQALHTPGHTPEHLSFLVTDTSTADEPVAAVTGDFLFVGDVGRPDLLERAANVAGTMESAARTLFHSLQRLQPFPDYLQIWPGHGAGSACGKSLGSLPQSTLGYERRHNWAFATPDEATFVARVLEGQPDPPRYFAEMKRVNKAGPRVLGRLPFLVRLDASKFDPLLAAGAVIVDIRHADGFAAAHVPGTLNLPLNRAFATWAGSLLPYSADLYLVAAEEQIEEAARALSLIGLDRVAGVFEPAAISGWIRAGHGLARVQQIDAVSLHLKMRVEPLHVLDVRSPAEWENGHIPGARHIPLSQLDARLVELPATGSIVVHCQGGARSAIAASLVQARSRLEVFNLHGGFREWEAAGYPVERGMSEPVASAK